MYYTIDGMEIDMPKGIYIHSGKKYLPHAEWNLKRKIIVKTEYSLLFQETKQRAILLMKEKGWYSFDGTDLHNKKYTDFYDNVILN